MEDLRTLKITVNEALEQGFTINAEHYPWYGTKRGAQEKILVFTDLESHLINLQRRLEQRIGRLELLS